MKSISDSVLTMKGTVVGWIGENKRLFVKTCDLSLCCHGIEQRAWTDSGFLGCPWIDLPHRSSNMASLWHSTEDASKPQYCVTDWCSVLFGFFFHRWRFTFYLYIFTYGVRFLKKVSGLLPKIISLIFIQHFPYWGHVSSKRSYNRTLQSRMCVGG